jgi:TPP-dependent pyruvate/acetoin dehydrogenase alpha subunit
MMDDQDTKYIEMFRKMLLIRAFDEQARNLYMKNVVIGSTHLYVGEEAIAVGVCATLNEGDYISSTHRGHGHCLAKGGDPNKMMAELLGKATGYCRGKGGSMHIADLDLGILGANGIVGGGISLATGSAFSCKYRKDGHVAVCFFGDGAINQGVFYEVANMASLWKLPIVYVCERNKFAEFSYSEWYFSDQDLTKRTEGFGFRGVEVDGNDLLAVYAAAQEAVDKARKGGGPSFLVANTYRIYGHTVGDPLTYRKSGEVDIWKDKDHDPILRFKIFLLKEEILADPEIEKIENEVDRIINQAVDFAINSPLPTPDSLLEDVYIKN